MRRRQSRRRAARPVAGGRLADSRSEPQARRRRRPCEDRAGARVHADDTGRYRLSLKDLRGKVVAVTFIDASCADTYPLLTAKMAGLQARLGGDFGPRVFFASITVDPERDTPEVLRRYAEAHGVKRNGWAFLTGTRAEIGDVSRRYGIYFKKTLRGDVDHRNCANVLREVRPRHSRKLRMGLGGVNRISSTMLIGNLVEWP